MWFTSSRYTKNVEAANQKTSSYICVMQVKKHSAANQKTTFEGTEGSKYTNQ